MKHFLNMIEIAQSDGIQIIPDLRDDRFVETKPLPKRVEAAFAIAKPFVFQPFEFDMPDYEYVPEVEKQDIAHLDMPFEACSFEFVNRSIYKCDTFEIFCTFSMEVEPTKFMALSLIYCFGKLRVVVDFPNKAVPFFLDKMEAWQVGSQSIGLRIKRKYREAEKDFKIRRVVHIVPKNSREKYESENHLKIDWSHRWLVRGHWRKIAGDALGKNRAGDYCQDGYTWVTDHEKGPEHAPLVADKVRFIKKHQQNEGNYGNGEKHLR